MSDAFFDADPYTRDERREKYRQARKISKKETSAKNSLFKENKMKKCKGIYVTGSLPKIKHLQAYYLQNGKWKKVKRIKGVTNCPTL